jgi:hypothetical protein
VCFSQIPLSQRNGMVRKEGAHIHVFTAPFKLTNQIISSSCWVGGVTHGETPGVLREWLVSHRDGCLDRVSYFYLVLLPVGSTSAMPFLTLLCLSSLSTLDSSYTDIPSFHQMDQASFWSLAAFSI